MDIIKIIADSMQDVKDRLDDVDDSWKDDKDYTDDVDNH